MTYRGRFRVRVEDKPYPETLHPNDAVVRVTRAAICGSDIHLCHGVMGDTRVVLVPFNVCCGFCYFCSRGLYGNCHNTNASATAAAGIYGYSHTCGGDDGGQAEYVRVPYANFGPEKIPEGISADAALMLTGALPTGY